MTKIHEFTSFKKTKAMHNLMSSVPHDSFKAINKDFFKNTFLILTLLNFNLFNLEIWIENLCVVNHGMSNWSLSYRNNQKTLKGRRLYSICCCYKPNSFSNSLIKWNGSVYIVQLPCPMLIGLLNVIFRD